MLITWDLHIRLKCYWEPHNEVVPLSLAKHLVGFESGLGFWSQHLNPLGYFSQISSVKLEKMKYKLKPHICILYVLF